MPTNVIKCRKCNEDMKPYVVSFDPLAMFTTNPHYCNNNTCEKYGDLTLAGNVIVQTDGSATPPMPGKEIL